MRTFILLVTISLSTYSMWPSLAYGDTTCKVALHAVGHSKNPTCSPTSFPCNAGESHILTTASVMTTYDVYVIVIDAVPAAGVSGVSFGLLYDGDDYSGVDIRSWKSCGNLAFPSSSWPAPASGMLVTWDPASNCQNSPVAGDSLLNTQAVVGVLEVYAYSSDRLSITGNAATSRIEMTTCSGALIELKSPRAKGALAFGTSEEGWDPCNPYNTFAEFDSIAHEYADSLEFWLSPLSSPEYQLMLYGPGGADAYLFDLFSLSVYEPTGEEAIARSAQLPITELLAIVDSLAGMNPIVRETVPGEGFVLTLATWANGQPRGFSTALDTTETLHLMEDLFEIVEEGQARELLFDSACGSDFMPEIAATDVTASVAVSLSGYQLDRKTGTYVTEISVENTSGSALQAPLHLLVDVGLPSKLQTYDGPVCSRETSARWFVTLLSSGSLGVGQTVNTSLRFSWTESGPTGLATWVYSGNGLP